MSPPNTVADDIEEAMRFEISGTDRSDRRQIAHRLREKAKQVRHGQDHRIGLAAVIGFAILEIRIQEVG